MSVDVDLASPPVSKGSAKIYASGTTGILCSAAIYATGTGLPTVSPTVAKKTKQKGD